MTTGRNDEATPAPSAGPQADTSRPITGAWDLFLANLLEEEVVQGGHPGPTPEQIAWMRRVFFSGAASVVILHKHCRDADDKTTAALVWAMAVLDVESSLDDDDGDRTNDEQAKDGDT